MHCRQNHLSDGCFLGWDSFIAPRELIRQCYLQPGAPVSFKTTSRDHPLNSYSFTELLFGGALG